MTIEALAFKPLVGKQKLSCKLATARMNIWEGAVRSSKTIASILAWIRYVRTAPPGDLAMIGKTHDTIKRNVVNVILDMLGQRMARYNAGTHELFIGARRIFVLGANDAKAETKIRGMTMAGAYIDELTLMPEPYFRMLGTRLSVPGARLYATTNPDNPQHWVMKSYLRKARLHITRNGDVVRNPPVRNQLDLHRFTFKLADNPHLSYDYLTALEAEYSGLWYKRFILGEWVMAEGAVFDMWDESMIVPPREIPHMERLVACGIDYGTRNPFVALLCGIAQGKIWLIDQWRWDSSERMKQLTSVRYSRAVREWMDGRQPEYTYVDPSAADFRLQLFNDGHPGVVAANNDVVPGIRTLASLMSADKFRVSAACTGFTSTAQSYSWDEKQAEKGIDKPIKVDDHDIDAARYGVHSSSPTWRAALGQAA